MKNNSRIKALYLRGGLDPFERYILQLLDRCVNFTPTELEYLNQIELKYSVVNYSHSPHK